MILICSPIRPTSPAEVIPGLTSEVRDHEPRIALDGSGDGLYFYRRIACEAGKLFMLRSGRIYLEIGYDQAAGGCCSVGGKQFL